MINRIHWPVLMCGILSMLSAFSRASTIGGTEGGIQPQITCDKSGAVHVVYGVGDEIRYVQSKDEGQTFTKPTTVAKVPGVMVGMRRGPRIAVSGHTLVVTAPTADLLCFVSSDDGKSWSKENKINDQAKSAREGLHSMVAIPDGGFFAIWLDDRNGKKEVWGAFSANGVKWDVNRKVYQSPSGSVCECCQPSVAVSANGELAVMWRNSLNGSRDMFVAKSKDRGMSFSEGTKLGTGTWKMNLCPMDGGSIAMDDDSGVLTVWRRDKTLYRSSSDQSETLLANGVQPVLVISNHIPVVVWGSNSTLQLKIADKAPISMGAGEYAALAVNSKSGNVCGVWQTPSKLSAIQFEKIETK